MLVSISTQRHSAKRPLSPSRSGTKSLGSRKSPVGAATQASTWGWLGGEKKVWSTTRLLRRPLRLGPSRMMGGSRLGSGRAGRAGAWAGCGSLPPAVAFGGWSLAGEQPSSSVGWGPGWSTSARDFGRRDTRVRLSVHEGPLEAGHPACSHRADPRPSTGHPCHR